MKIEKCYRVSVKVPTLDGDKDIFTENVNVLDAETRDSYITAMQNKYREKAKNFPHSVPQPGEENDG